MEKIASNIGELIGNTPLVKLNRITKECHANVIAKLEFFNPAGCIKERIAWAMIESAEKAGIINENTTIIEPSSGNTGIGLAFTCAVKGYRLIITMPESMSIERRNIIQGFGAEIVLTPAPMGMKGAIEKAKELKDVIQNSYIPQQFANPANPLIHKQTTAEEIWKDTNGKVDITEALKSKNSSIKSIAVEPSASPVLSGGCPSPHKIQGIGAGFIPEILNLNLIDEIIQVSNEDAISTAQKLMRMEGILCGISSGAATWAALQVAKREENKGKMIIVIIPDTGERYISTDLFKF